MMDERRDLVDREELRRRIAEDPFSASEVWEMHLDAMPAVECQRVWTRDEVLKELDAYPGAVCEFQNPYSGNWHTLRRGAVNAWHPEVRSYGVRVVRVAPEPEWVPLTQLVGRTIDKCDEEVQGYASDAPLSWRNKKWQWFPFPEGTLNLETGQVAVRPKAAT